MADQTDPVAARLKMAPATDAMRADVWDAFHAATSADDFASKIQDIKLPDAVKADLWDLKHQQTREPDFKSSVVGDPSLLDRAAETLPSIGGAIGSLVGGTPGAALGGAAGAGYRTIYRNAPLIGPALRDVGRNMIDQPAATLRGFVQGAAHGATDAGVQGAVQAGANIIGNKVGAIAAPYLKSAGAAVMQSALKPSVKTFLQSLKAGTKVPRVVQTLLDEGVNVTPGGIDKLNDIISATNQEISNALGSLPSRARVSTLKVASRLNDVAKRVGAQVNPTDDLRAVSEAGQEFLDSQGSASMRVGDAQALKVGTYEQLKAKSYGELKSSAIEAQKALARGLKEEIANEAAKSGFDISSLNLREGSAIQALDAVAKRVAQAGNANPLGLASLAVSHPVTFITTLMDRSGPVKSMIAHGMYNSAARVTGVSAAAIRAAVATIAAGQAQAGPQ